MFPAIKCGSVRDDSHTPVMGGRGATEYRITTLNYETTNYLS